MKPEIIELMKTVLHILQVNMRWMTWNLFLAFIPLALSVWLFRNKRSRSWLRWPVSLTFYAFLPNAPYLLTDVIHLIHDIRTVQSIWMITLVLIPVYFVVIFSGFAAYVISLINLGYYLHRIDKSKWIFPVELITHALCAVGIYWGRFLRFNSWDFVTQPDEIITKGVEELLGKQPLIIIILTFIILCGLHWLLKKIILNFVDKGFDPHDKVQVRHIHRF
ncbi:DUF1361 domain-containing protein [Dolichospermum planctonicum]|uniref:DUF1361 domain-containing protein n=1 Tax=Dolichospermum planctonicum TaxID=136072 RepID=A0A480A948_9CYAN|nr:DUF1361 domain-containing protein [Dolichospermum planctonicum]GCL41487.1 hypothetical protein NIES80_11820 [Dolichospermum planctonicum]